MSLICNSVDQSAGYGLQWQDIDRGTECGSGFWHAVNGTGRLVLRYRVVAIVTERLQALGAIPSHPGQ